MRQILISCATCAACAVALPASAQDTLYRCIDRQGVTMLTDRPCETLPNAPRPALEKEYFVLPPSELGRGRWVKKPPVSVPPKVDVETLRLARQALELRDKVASAR
ncbi:MAG: hypothetical protein K0R43_1896 [Pseudoduganella sp.]|jgi:hypothetical protein|nr:hypothetical protein [Pseudoduganella sp.]